MLISPEEDSAFTAAKALIDYLRVYGIHVSGGTLEHHMRYLGVTEAQAD